MFSKIVLLSWLAFATFDVHHAHAHPVHEVFNMHARDRRAAACR